MVDTKKLRVKYNNEWPNSFLFPSELLLKEKMEEVDLKQVFSPALLKDSSEQDFHSLLGNFLESLDQLPYRPDASFDAIWKALDAEFFRLKDEENSKSNISRFDFFISYVIENENTCKEFYSIAVIIPLQTCEYVAKRIITNSISAGNHSDMFLKRIKKCLGEGLYTAIIGKYNSNWGSNSASIQRKAGMLIRKLIVGEEININNVNYTLNKRQVADFLISVIMTQFRNERFHGTTFPPFRSSVATMKTYAHCYYIFHLAYALLLEVFLYREFGVIDQQSTSDAIKENRRLFSLVFDKCLMS